MPETLQTTTPERVDQAEVDASLDWAMDTVRGIAQDADFQSFLVDKNRKLDPEDQLTYWWNVADYTDHYLEATPSLAPLDRESFTLIANLPNAMIASAQLDEHDKNRARLKSSRFKVAKNTVCSYNDLMKHYVTTFPQQSKALEAHLLEATLATAGANSHEIMQFANHNIASRLKGIRYEIGFAAILDKIAEITDLTYRPATLEEDLKGRDFVLNFRGHEFGVDVKASLDKVENLNGGASEVPYALNRNNDVVLWPLLHEADFGLGFSPDPERIETIWPTVAAYLQAAVNQSIAK